MANLPFQFKFKEVGIDPDAPEPRKKVGKLRYSEAFYSVQGEGKFVGVPSVFLRTFGCNFRCMNFGLSRGEKMRDVKQKEGIIHNQEVQSLLDNKPQAPAASAPRGIAGSRLPEEDPFKRRF